MSKKQSSASRKGAQKGRAKRGRRGLRVLLVVLEAVMICILSVGCYAVNLLGTLERKDIAENDIYIYTAPVQTTAEPQTTEAADKTEGSEEETGWTVETEVAETEEDIDFLRTRETSDGYWNILVLGVDARKDDSLSGGDYRSDVIMICSINVNTKNVKMVSIYRDTVLKMYSSKQYIKINDGVFAGAGGSIEGMISTLNYNLDLNIKDVVVVNWAAVALAVNCLGGLELDITQEEIVGTPEKGSIINGYLTEIVENTEIATIGPFTEPGLQWCDGPRVVAYCRNRYTTGNDFNRTGRQREVMTKLLEKAKVASPTDLLQAVRKVFGNMYTSLTINDLFLLVQDIGSYTIEDTIGFPEDNISQTYVGSFADDGIKDPVVPNTLAENVSSLHAFLYGQEGYQPSANVQEISAEIQSKAGQ